MGVLEQLQLMDVQKISVIQSAIKAKCESKRRQLMIKNETQTISQNHPILQKNQSNPNRSTLRRKQSNVGLGEGLESLLNKYQTSVSPKITSSHQQQQNKKFNYSRARHSKTRPITSRIQTNNERRVSISNQSTMIKQEVIENKSNANTEEIPSTAEDMNSFKMLIPKRKHLIKNDNQNTFKSERSIKKIKKEKTKSSKKKKQKKNKDSPKKSKKIKKEKSKKRKVGNKKKSKTKKKKIP